MVSDKKTDAKIQKEVDKRVELEVKKKVDEHVEKEVKKRLAVKLFSKTKASTLKFRNEFKIQTVAAITAAFAFLIALSWRVPIEKSVNGFIIKLNLQGSEMFIQYLSAILITIVAVVALILLSRWKSSGK
ncbi:hypothetical protein GOV12_06770 [Candidatus Pacearchaeota archaeon]|nr:hypothetical protein [Candidatus Pacearchaeota archaeon]